MYKKGARSSAGYICTSNSFLLTQHLPLRHLCFFFITILLTVTSTNILAVASQESQKLRDERTHRIESETDRYSINVEYPSLNKPIVDGAITLWVLHQIEAFKQGLEEIPSEDTSKFSLNITFELISVSPKAVSILFFIATDTGNEYAENGLATFTYDLEKNTQLAYDDIFARSENLFTFFSLYCYESFSKSAWALRSPSLLVAGTSPIPANFAFFTLDPAGITLYFPAHQVAAGDLGLQKVTIPLSELHIFQPNLTLWKKRGLGSRS